MRLADRRVLVVGASSGIGRATGRAIAAEGGRVAFAARRLDRLKQAVADAGEQCFALFCDVCEEADCTSVVAEAVATLGGLDALVYSPGIGVFKPVEEIGADEWRHAFETNVLGATLVMRAALPHLREVRGKAVFFSSISIDDAPPRSNYAPYVVTKVALETLIQAWQGEHPSVGFTTIAIGDTTTEFGFDHDPDVLGSIVQRWVQDGYMYGRTMEAASVAEQVVNVLASPETVRRLAITPRYGDESDAVVQGVWDRD